MPTLLEGPAPLKTRFVDSLPHSFLATVGLLCAASRFEGLGDWLQETGSHMDPALYEELCLLVTFPGGFQRFTSELIACLPANAAGFDYDALAAHMRAVPAGEYQQMALRALSRGSDTAPESDALLNLLNRPDDLSAYLSSIGSEREPALVATLVQDGSVLKDRVLAALDSYWSDHFQPEFSATRPLMNHSVVYHQSLPKSPRFEEQFVVVTGRLLPERVSKLLPTMSQVTFVASCYVGPYVAYSHFRDQLVVYYNCRVTPASPTAADGASLYPPLKALADETRLQILAMLQDGELYAQEIVERLGLSQPAVSRHLNLMAAAGVLTIRRQGNSKYYGLDRKALARVANALRAFG